MTTKKKSRTDMEIILLPLRRFITKKIKTKDGRVHDLYSLGALAEATQRDTHTLRVWQKNGWIPKPLIKISSTDTRYYLKEEIQAYVWAIEKCKLRSGLNVERSGFPQVLREELDKVWELFNRTVEENLQKAEPRKK